MTFRLRNNIWDRSAAPKRLRIVIAGMRKYFFIFELKEKTPGYDFSFT